MKNLLLPLFLFLYNVVYSQVGINIKTPLSTLHVNGDVQITKSLTLGGNANTPGDAGKVGGFLMSQGENNAAIWATPISLNIPSVSGIGKTNKSINNIVGATFTVIKYDVQNRINTEVLSYDQSSGNYKILKSGYYLINSNATLTVNPNQSYTDGSLRFALYINDESKLSVLGSFPISAPNPIRESLAGIYYMNVNDYFNLQVNYTRSYNLLDSNISVTYLYNP